MAEPVVIRGRYVDRTFVPDEPLPTGEGPAELIVFLGAMPPARAMPASIFDLFGKAVHPRTAEDIADQVREEREAWGEPSLGLGQIIHQQSPIGSRVGIRINFSQGHFDMARQ